MTSQYRTTGFSLTPELEKYANGKLAHLARKVPRSLRAHANCEVTFSQIKRKESKASTCSIVLSAGSVNVHSTETTQHMYAALDIAAVHIEQQLKDSVRTWHKGLFSRLNTPKSN